MPGNYPVAIKASVERTKLKKKTYYLCHFKRNNRARFDSSLIYFMLINFHSSTLYVTWETAEDESTVSGLGMGGGEPKLNAGRL